MENASISRVGGNDSDQLKRRSEIATMESSVLTKARLDEKIHSFNG
ncbi:MAG: hypothetical protein ACJA0Z_004462 [Halioglobus sp.]|jgi:hypothetical protein